MRAFNAIILSIFLAAGVAHAAGQQTEAVDNAGESISWLESASKEGNVRAQAKLGSKYIQGTDVTRDTAKGLKLMRQAADNGYIVAQDFLAGAYAQGLLGISKDSKEATKWFRKAAEQGSRRSALRVSQMYLDGQGSLQDAYFWALIAEKLGYVDPGVPNAAAANREVIGWKLTEVERQMLEADAKAWQPKLIGVK